MNKFAIEHKSSDVKSQFTYHNPSSDEIYEIIKNGTGGGGDKSYHIHIKSEQDDGNWDTIYSIEYDPASRLFEILGIDIEDAGKHFRVKEYPDNPEHFGGVLFAREINDDELYSSAVSQNGLLAYISKNVEEIQKIKQGKKNADGKVEKEKIQILTEKTLKELKHIYEITGKVRSDDFWADKLTDTQTDAMVYLRNSVAATLNYAHIKGNTSKNEFNYLVEKSKKGRQKKKNAKRNNENGTHEDENVETFIENTMVSEIHPDVETFFWGSNIKDRTDGYSIEEILKLITDESDPMEDIIKDVLNRDQRRIYNNDSIKFIISDAEWEEIPDAE